MKRNDILLIVGVLLTAFLCAVLYFLAYPKDGDMVQITINGTVTKTFPLNEDTTYTISNGDSQKNILEIKNGTAQIISADCPDKLCVHQKKISRQGETLVCLPHKVVVSIISTKKATLDGVAQ